MRFERFAVELKSFRMLRTAALALAIAAGPAAPAAAEPTFSDFIGIIYANPGQAHSFEATQLFTNAGTNPRFTAVTFSTTDYYTNHGIDDGELVVQPKTAAELSAMSPPPSSPILVDVTVTMTNDENEEASGSFQFSTRYEQIAQPPPQPTFKADLSAGTASAGALIRATADDYFDNAGAGAAITEAALSTTDYYNPHSIHNGVFFVTVKTDPELNALSPQPPSPFDVDVTLRMTNDAGHTATGTITFTTTYARIDASTPAPAFRDPGTVAAAPGATLTYRADELFDNAGAGAEITGTQNSNPDYITIDSIQLLYGVLQVNVKTAAELNALETPPASPFTVDITVEMSNRAGQTASGTITFQTTYDRVEPEAPATGGPGVTQPGGAGDGG